MRFFALALLIPVVLGTSIPSGSGKHCAPLEIDSATVNTLVNDYAQLIGNYTPALGQSFLSDTGFTDTSDSINVLANITLGSTTFGSKAAFMASQATQPKVPLVVKSINAVTCDTVVLRWTQTFGQADLPISGISILVFACEGGEWKLKTLYTEFNSLVYIEDAGGSCTAPSF